MKVAGWICLVSVLAPLPGYNYRAFYSEITMSHVVEEATVYLPFTASPHTEKVSAITAATVSAMKTQEEGRR